MNPHTNKFEPLTVETTDKQLEELKNTLVEAASGLVRPDGTPVPKHWSVFRVGELVVVKDYTFRVAYIGESTLLLEPVGLPEL